MTPLDPDSLKAAFARLKAIHGLKNAYALKDENSEEGVTFTAEWLRQLTKARIRSEELELAVDAWLADKQDGWPTPGDIKQLVWAQYGKAPRQAQVWAPESGMVWCLVTRNDGSTYHRYFPRDAMPHNAIPVGEA